MMGQPLSVGLICPGGGVKNPENEMGKYKPDDVTILAERIPLAGVNDGFEKMKQGHSARSVIVFDQ